MSYFAYAYVAAPSLFKPRKQSVREATGQTGSMRYMAPEVALNKPYSHRAEIFAFAPAPLSVRRVRPMKRSSLAVSSAGAQMHSTWAGFSARWLLSSTVEPAPRPL